jgi:hypothetical protein
MDAIVKRFIDKGVEAVIQKATAFAHIMENALGAEKGTFQYIIEKFQSM